MPGVGIGIGIGAGSESGTGGPIQLLPPSDVQINDAGSGNVTINWFFADGPVPIGYFVESVRASDNVTIDSDTVGPGAASKLLFAGSGVEVFGRVTNVGDGVNYLSSPPASGGSIVPA